MEKIFEYLSQLETNNNREWYHLHKAERQQANQAFEDLIQCLIMSIGQFDDSVLNNIPKDLTFKLVRDTRFSLDKSPYNPCFRAHISSRGKLPIPVGYFLMIKPHNNSFIGGGLFGDMFKDATRMIRDYIAANGEEFDKIVQAETFCKFFQLKGEQLKNTPQGYDADSKWAKYLKFKSWYIEYFLQDEQVKDKNFIANATEVFAAMKPFNDFLNRALKDFVMPQRP